MSLFNQNLVHLIIYFLKLVKFDTPKYNKLLCNLFKFDKISVK